jgi:hypothetical protein
MIPKPPPLPGEIISAIRGLRTKLEASGHVLRLNHEIARRWDSLVAEWADAEDLPLIVRRGGHPEMCMEIIHQSGRKVAPADNSPAHWIVIQIFSDEANAQIPSLEYIRKNLLEIPMTMRMGKLERAESTYKKTLDDYPHIALGSKQERWYLAHIDPIGLGRRGDLRQVPLSDLKNHFKKLMSPFNMMLVASSIAGLGELEMFLETPAED